MRIFHYLIIAIFFSTIRLNKEHKFYFPLQLSTIGLQCVKNVQKYRGNAENIPRPSAHYLHRAPAQHSTYFR